MPAPTEAQPGARPDAEPLRCGIPARTLPPCDLEWGHDGDMHANAGDGFYSREHDEEHHRRQADNRSAAEHWGGGVGPPAPSAPAAASEALEVVRQALDGANRHSIPIRECLAVIEAALVREQEQAATILRLGAALAIAHQERDDAWRARESIHCSLAAAVNDLQDVRGVMRDVDEHARCIQERNVYAGAYSAAGQVLAMRQKIAAALKDSVR